MTIIRMTVIFLLVFIPSINSFAKMVEPDHKYSLDIQNRKIIYDDRVIYIADDGWDFVCIKTDSLLANSNGTVSFINDSRVIPSKCNWSFKQDILKKSDLHFAAWQLDKSSSVFFILSDYSGGNNPQSNYLVIEFNQSILKKTYKPFLAGEYFRFYSNEKCTGFRNEYDKNEGVVWSGSCDLSEL